MLNLNAVLRLVFEIHLIKDVVDVFAKLRVIDLNPMRCPTASTHHATPEGVADRPSYIRHTASPLPDRVLRVTGRSDGWSRSTAHRSLRRRAVHTCPTRRSHGRVQLRHS